MARPVHDHEGKQIGDLHALRRAQTTRSYPHGRELVSKRVIMTTSGDQLQPNIGGERAMEKCLAASQLFRVHATNLQSAPESPTKSVRKSRQRQGRSSQGLLNGVTTWYCTTVLVVGGAEAGSQYALRMRCRTKVQYLSVGLRACQAFCGGDTKRPVMALKAVSSLSLLRVKGTFHRRAGLLRKASVLMSNTAATARACHHFMS